MEFTGTIIITDPCYIVKPSKKDYQNAPKEMDYLSYNSVFDYPDVR